MILDSAGRYVLICADKRLYDAKRRGGNVVVAPTAIADTRREGAPEERPS